MDFIWLLLVLALILFFPIACGVVASSKNRSVFGWVVVSLFLPLIGFVILLCLSPLPSRVLVGSYTTTKICPFCGEVIQKIAKKCKHCGEFLPTKAPVQRYPEPKTNQIKNKSKVKEWERICQQIDA
jgi:hypothetical protein